MLELPTFTLGQDDSCPLELQFLNGQCLQEAPTSSLLSGPETNHRTSSELLPHARGQDALLSSVPS